ncbi:MAG: potassium transporter Trk [Microbacterium sp.]
MTEPAEHRVETARVRRVPRYTTFFLLGTALGILAALILSVVFDGTAEESPNTQVLYSTSQVFGFLLLVCIPVGLALGGGVALLFDRSLARRARDVRIERARIELPDPDGPADLDDPADPAS